jgi:hypothetical protein
VTGSTFDVTVFHRLSIPFNSGGLPRVLPRLRDHIPMFPFHTWLPDAYTDAPTAVRILAAVLLKRAPTDSLLACRSCRMRRSFCPACQTLRIIGIAWRARRARAEGLGGWSRFLRHHMAMVMLGMFALNPVGITGSIIQQLNHGAHRRAPLIVTSSRSAGTRVRSELLSLEGDAGLRGDLPDHDDVVGRLSTLNASSASSDSQGAFTSTARCGRRCGERAARRGLHSISTSGRCSGRSRTRKRHLLI